MRTAAEDAAVTAAAVAAVAGLAVAAVAAEEVTAAGATSSPTTAERDVGSPDLAGNSPYPTRRSNWGVPPRVCLTDADFRARGQGIFALGWARC